MWRDIQCGMTSQSSVTDISAECNTCDPTQPTTTSAATCLHVSGTVGGHRDHRHSHWDAAAGGAGCPQSRAANGVHEQFEKLGVGRDQLRVGQHALSTPGLVDDDDNHQDALHSGFVFLLPFIEQNNLFDKYDQSQPWTSPVNLPLAQQQVPLFSCPENESAVEQDGGAPGAAIDYAFSKGDLAYLSLNVVSSGVFGINSETTFANISDGASNTFLMGEAASNPNIPCAAT